MKELRPVVLIVMDGWGIAQAGPGNAVSLAKTPNIEMFRNAYPGTLLIASGEAVGLPRGEDGNSETGHMNMGAGQIVYQDLPRINMAIADGSFYKNEAFLEVAKHVKRQNSNLHILGLIGAGGVHSNIEHFYALLLFCKEQNIENVFFHVFTDGRDSPPASALTYIDSVLKKIKELGFGKIATICGRYYAMDRDLRWERTQKAYEAIVDGVGVKEKDPIIAIKDSYNINKTDEFILPTVMVGEDGNPVGLINDRDGVIFFNFRIDRPRQLTKAFVLPNFESHVSKRIAFDPYAERYGKKQYEYYGQMTTFKRKKILKDLFFVTMTEYEANLPVTVAFGPEKVGLPLGKILSDKGLRQLRVSETEKERFVTYYFNGCREDPFLGEDRIEISSPKVATYDLKPEMSAYEIKETVILKLKSKIYDFMLINFANPDMVGHTGVLKAGIKACEVTDDCVGKIVATVSTLGGVTLVTADHGNVEEMINLQTGGVDTEHSTNPVPFIIVANRLNSLKGSNLQQGILADVAPTVLDFFGIDKPSCMTGRSLLKL
jgi:2,3-bisphosphoglycerate-independent phosphoglycerate mutase